MAAHDDHEPGLADNRAVRGASGIVGLLHRRPKDDSQAQANAEDASIPQKREQESKQKQESPPTATQVAIADTHCGSGCTLGDIGGEWWVFLMGLMFVGSEFPTRTVMDFVLAWSLGIIFQYSTIAPMRGLSVGRGILEAIPGGYAFDYGV